MTYEIISKNTKTRIRVNSNPLERHTAHNNFTTSTSGKNFDEFNMDKEALEFEKIIIDVLPILIERTIILKNYLIFNLKNIVWM